MYRREEDYRESSVLGVVSNISRSRRGGSKGNWETAIPRKNVGKFGTSESYKIIFPEYINDHSLRDESSLK